MKFAIGVDIGGTYTKVGVVNTTGEISDYKKFKTIDNENIRENFLKKLFSEIATIISNTDHKITGIGVSMLGLQMENGSGTYCSANIPEFNMFDIKKPLADKFDLPVVVTNDLMAHSIAEYHFGTNNKCDRFLNVAVGTGIGAAMILKGKPLLLFGGTTGDCGRIILDPDSKIKCSGKVFGSAEALCGVRGIEILARKYYPYNNNYTASEIIHRAREGKDKTAIKIMEEIGKYVGLLLADLSFIFFPQIICVSGGTIEAGEKFIEACRKQFKHLAGDFHNMLNISGKKRKIKIKKAKLGNKAGIIGGAFTVLEPYIDKNN
jgi:glucokinase